MVFIYLKSWKDLIQSIGKVLWQFILNINNNFEQWLKNLLLKLIIKWNLKNY